MNPHFIGLVKDALSSMTFRWGAGEEAPAFLNFVDYLTLSIDDAVDLRFRHPDNLVDVYNFLPYQRANRTQTAGGSNSGNLAPLGFVEIRPNRWTRGTVPQVTGLVETLCGDNVSLLRFLARGLGQLEDAFRGAPLRSVTSGKFREANQIWCDALGEAHAWLSEAGVPHTFITRFPQRDGEEWLLCASLANGGIHSFVPLEDPELADLATRCFTTGLVQHAGRASNGRRLLVPVHYRRVAWAVVMLDFSSADEDWVRAFHLYREGAVFTALRGYIDVAKMTLLDDLFRGLRTEVKDLKKGRARSKTSSTALADLRRLPPLIFPDPFAGLTLNPGDQELLRFDADSPFLRYGLVLPSRGSAANPIALWAAHKQADLKALHATSGSKTGMLKPPYRIYYNDDPLNPVIVIRVPNDSAAVTHPQDRSLLCALVLARRAQDGNGVVPNKVIETICLDETRRKATTATAIVQEVRRSLKKNRIDPKHLFKSARKVGCQLLHGVKLEGAKGYQARGHGNNMESFDDRSSRSDSRRVGKTLKRRVEY